MTALMNLIRDKHVSVACSDLLMYAVSRESMEHSMHRFVDEPLYEVSNHCSARTLVSANNVRALRAFSIHRLTVLLDLEPTQYCSRLVNLCSLKI